MYPPETLLWVSFFFLFLSFSLLLFSRSIYGIYIDLAFVDFSQKQVWHVSLFNEGEIFFWK